MSDPWADSLSEDWISQPRDSPPPAPASTRILHESSTTNRRPSTSSIASSTGTENIKGAKGGKKDIPEWKRMVMEDFATPGGKDLFSPMQLECMFRPPTIGPSGALPSQGMRAVEDPPKRLQEGRRESPKRLQEGRRESPHRVREEVEKRLQEERRENRRLHEQEKRLHEERSHSLHEEEEEEEEEEKSPKKLHKGDGEKDSPQRTPAKWKSNIPIPTSSPRPPPLVPESRKALFSPARTRTKSTTSLAATSPPATTTAPRQISKLRQSLGHRKSSSSSSILPSLTPDGKRSPERQNTIAETETSGLSDLRMNENWSSIRVPGVTGPVHSRSTTSSEVRRDEDISSIVVDRLRSLKEPGGSFDMSPPGTIGSALAAHDSQYLPTGQDSDEESEAADTVPELLSAPPTGPRRRKSLLSTDGTESSIYPSSPPVLGYNYDSEGEDDYDASYLEKSTSSNESPGSPFESPSKQPAAEDLAQKLLASPFLPAGQEPRSVSPSKRPAPALPPQGELPGAAGNSILDNIRRHKDAPKSPVKPHPPARDESMSPDEHEDPFFTPHALRGQLVSEDNDNERDKTRTSGSPLKLFASFYDTYTNERLTRRLGELETSVEDEGHLKVPGGEDYDSQFGEEETDISFSGGGSIVVNRLEKMARKQEKAKSPSRRVRPALAQRHASAPEASPGRSLTDGYRKHRRWRSDESGAADGVEAPRSPLKERTPKRVRRNINGVYNQRGPSSGVPPVPELIRARSEEAPSTPVGKMRRVTDGATPTSAAKRKERKVPVLKKNYEYGDTILSPGVNVSPRKDGGSVVFSGSRGDGAEGEGFEMPSPMQPETVRKGSVTTQDFLDQADAVMNRIRDRGLRSVALDFQSPGSQYSVREDGSYYDELSVRTAPRRDSGTGPQLPNSPLRNEVPDIQVTRNSSSREGSFDGKSSTVKTAVSSSSRKSAVEVISPGDGVMSHHLAMKNNGMTFDEEKMTWVKRGSSPAEEEEEQVLKIEDSDPFIGISDLSVDSQEEARALELARRNWEGMASDGEKSGLWRSSRMMGIDEEDEEDGIGDETWDRQQWFGDEEVVVGGEQSTVGSGSSERSSRSTRPGSGAETRTTSYGSDENKEKVEKVEEDETEEIAREVKTSEPLRRARNSYAEEYESPTTQSMVQDSSSPGDHPLLWTDEGDSTTDGGIDGFLEHGNLRQQRRNTSRTFSSGGTYRGAARRRSSGAKNFIGRPISRITEEEEDDHHHHHNGPAVATPVQRELSRISMSSALTPLPSPFMSKVNSLSLSATRKVNDLSFQMTPLADLSYQFETTDALINLELSFFATRKGAVNAKAIEASFTIARDNLLKNLTDVEPYEPYWDHMKELDLAGRKVETLFTLNDWCPRLEVLDACDNELGQLSGVSESVRDLKVAGNCLSGITHFGHLVNLQYLDVSRNGLENLDGLRGLRHLREVKADDNVIESIDGVLGMDGLSVLRARRNRLVAVDFAKAMMPRLTELDLRGNDIESVSGLQNLPALINLNLDQNNLDSLNVPLGTKLDSIRCIKLTQNYFETFDVSQYPNLRILYMDNNRLRGIEGLSRAKHLDAISTREQEHDGRECTLKFERMYEARKIYMSGNPLRELSIKLDFLNLQYLELASAQLTTLPKDFGDLVCNTRVLNLNNNAISDLRPLLGIVRLKKLLLVGNRVRSVKKIAAVLGYFPSLSYLDLRMNPLTIGFYPPSSVRKAILSAEDPDEYPKDPFTMMPADEGIDHTFQAQLDIDSAVVRRTYEITIGRRCPRMKELDGLEYRKNESMREDGVFEELKNRGLIKAPDNNTAASRIAPKS